MGSPELLEQGREPAGDVASAHPRARLAAWGALALAAVVGLSTWYVRAGTPTDSSPAAPPVTPSAGATTSVPRGASAPFPSPAETALVSGLAERHDLVAPAAPAMDSFIASGGHALLFLQVRNTTGDTMRIVDGLVPQSGVSRDLTAGGLTAGTSLGRPLPGGATAEVFVRVRLQCPEVLDGPPTTAVMLVAERTGQRPRMERVDVSALGPYWDEARHAGCSTPDPGRDVTVRPVPGSVRATLVGPGVADLSARLAVHDAAGFAAVVSLLAPDARRGQGRLVVEGGATREVPVVLGQVACAAALPPLPTYRVELLEGSASVPAVLDPAAAAEWRAALDLACRG